MGGLPVTLVNKNHLDQFLGLGHITSVFDTCRSLHYCGLILSRSQKSKKLNLVKKKKKISLVVHLGKLVPTKRIDRTVQNVKKLSSTPVLIYLPS